jgi:glycerol uptake facilitator-like aquaporin
LILVFGPVSGAHLNPLVTLSRAWQDGGWRHVPAYVAAQCGGALAGVALANMMFGLPPFAPSTHPRNGWPLLMSETLATFGLLITISGCARFRSAACLAVPAYITGAYWFTSSTSFANPAVTLARALTDTFSGIRPGDAPGFVGAQLAGAALAVALGRWLFRDMTRSSQLATNSFTAGRHET